MHAQQKGRLKTCNTGFQTASRFFKIPPARQTRTNEAMTQLMVQYGRQGSCSQDYGD